MKITTTILIVLLSVVTVAAAEAEPLTFEVSGYGKVFYTVNMCELIVGVGAEHHVH